MCCLASDVFHMDVSLEILLDGCAQLLCELCTLQLLVMDGGYSQTGMGFCRLVQWSSFILSCWTASAVIPSDWCCIYWPVAFGNHPVTWSSCAGYSHLQTTWLCCVVHVLLGHLFSYSWIPETERGPTQLPEAHQMWLVQTQISHPQSWVLLARNLAIQLMSDQCIFLSCDISWFVKKACMGNLVKCFGKVHKVLWGLLGHLYLTDWYIMEISWVSPDRDWRNLCCRS